jgi:hypothetical protein
MAEMLLRETESKPENCRSEQHSTPACSGKLSVLLDEK